MHLRRMLIVSGVFTALALCISTTGILAHKPVTSKYTYNDHIFPLFKFYCGGCHRPDGIAPMSLLTYREAYPWAESIKEQLLADTMHPWQDDEQFSRIISGRRMTPRQLDTIVDWATGGTPEGRTPLFSPETSSGAEWQLGEPDLILSMDRSEVVDANTMEKTVEVVLLTGLTEDRWLRTLDLRPGTPRIVHDAVIYLASGGQDTASFKDGVDLPAEHILGVWIPGQIKSFTENSAAYRIPAGARLTVRMHYRKNWQDEGVEISDRSRLGLYFTTAVQPRRTLTLRRSGQATGSVSHPDTVVFSQSFAREVILTSLMPWMSRHGRSIQVMVDQPDGRTVRLLKIVRFDPAWPVLYDFPEPVLIPRGSRLTIQGWYNPMDTAEAGPSGEHRFTVWLGYMEG